ncbi:Hypothetical Protein FCC1311_074952 [Hondaea fermentalgiana]|uniref:Uncharacterized protein n=1 Tax=Hondaea fermentalgiana TaxID=2315210 RepID=A0A2R5GTQ9_9STRA|nr:Hypothetical Protein FCC1311_074952 [Hondaea fermentalgiana]|eukprot:GBG31274.1 Hypothetical Protein FCC1311_074952 [Hondaea fermentalgiana]
MVLPPAPSLRTRAACTRIPLRHARGDVEETTVVVRKTQPGQQQGQQQGQQRVQHMQMQGQPRGLAWDAASGQVDRCEVVDSDLEHRQMILDAFS